MSRSDDSKKKLDKSQTYYMNKAIKPRDHNRPIKKPNVEKTLII